jgi:hypothetical protein
MKQVTSIKMKSQTFIIVIAILLTGSKSFSQEKTDIAGTWKGTSICQVKNSPCHDETVVYHITKLDSANLFKVSANKIVNNAEEFMGDINLTYDPATHTLFSIDTERDATWRFIIKGEKMEGTLVLKKNLYRIVNLSKE